MIYEEENHTLTDEELNELKINIDSQISKLNGNKHFDKTVKLLKSARAKMIFWKTQYKKEE